MGFVEGVSRKGLHLVEQTLGELALHAVGLGAGHEVAAHLGHLNGILLAHGLAQDVRLAEAEPGQQPGDLHHLLLVDDGAKGAAQHRLQVIVRVGHRLVAVLAVDVVIVGAIVQRAGPEQRHERQDVVDVVRQQAAHQVLHAAGFKLEHGGGLGALEQVEGGCIVQGHSVDVHARPATLGIDGGVDGLHGPVDDGQRGQPQEVELHQARLLHVVLVVLRDQAAAALINVERHEVGQAGRRDHHAAGMPPDVAHDAFELVAHLHDLGGFLVGANEVPQFRALRHGLAQLDVEFVGNELGEFVPQGVGLALGAGHVAHHRLGGHGAKGGDLADRVLAVALRDMLDHPIAAFHAKIHVEIRHGDPLGVEETLKQQVIVDGIQVGDAQRVGDQRPGTGAPARPHRNALLLGPSDEFHDHQEIARKPRLVDNAELIGQAFPIGPLIKGIGIQGAQLFKTLGQPFLGGLGQETLKGLAFGHRIVGQSGLVEFQLQGAALGDLHAVGQRLRQVSKQLRHVARAFQVLFR